MGGNTFSKNVGASAAAQSERREPRSYHKLQKESPQGILKIDGADTGLAGENGKGANNESVTNVAKEGNMLSRFFSGSNAKMVDQQVDQQAKEHGEDTSRKEGHFLSRLFSRQPGPRKPSFRLISSTVTDPDGDLSRMYREATAHAAEERARADHMGYPFWQPPFPIRSHIEAHEGNTREQHAQDNTGNPATNAGEEGVSAKVDRELADNWENLNDNQPIKAMCTSCLEEFANDDCPSMDCGHNYCGECIRTLFTRAIDDEHLFPPQCCAKPITLGRVQFFLPEDLILRYSIRKVEVNTFDRTYCSNRDCAGFISPLNIVDLAAVCQACGVVTCALCKDPGHDGDCSPDPALTEVFEIADKEGWKRCTKCGTMIELDEGCNHITCKCGHHFCYICSAQWRSCDCPYFQRVNNTNLCHRAQRALAELEGYARQLDEGYLADNEGDIGDDDNLWNELPFRPLNGANARVYPELYFILNRHECAHEDWAAMAGGAGRCAYCQLLMDAHVYRCRRCLYRACYHCRHYELGI